MHSGRFAILEHRTAQAVHWDFLFQWGDVLRTWAVERLPAPGLKVAARRLPDHRMRYLDYEGPVSQDRGYVTQWDAGTFTLVTESPQTLVLELAGRKMSGRMAIASESDDAPTWVTVYEA